MTTVLHIVMNYAEGKGGLNYAKGKNTIYSCSFKHECWHTPLEYSIQHLQCVSGQTPTLDQAWAFNSKLLLKKQI